MEAVEELECWSFAGEEVGLPSPLVVARTSMEFSLVEDQVLQGERLDCALLALLVVSVEPCSEELLLVEDQAGQGA